MKRFVVMKDFSLSKPVYIAESEADAARFLDGIEQTMNQAHRTRENSLTLKYSAPNTWTTYFVVACESWEKDTEQTITEG